MEVLATGVPGVVVPFAGGSETEQTQRARALAAQDLLTVVPEDGLDPARLADGIVRALAQGGSHGRAPFRRSEEHTSELQSLMRISYAVFCLKKKKKQTRYRNENDM